MLYNKQKNIQFAPRSPSTEVILLAIYHRFLSTWHILDLQTVVNVKHFTCWLDCFSAMIVEEEVKKVNDLRWLEIRWGRWSSMASWRPLGATGTVYSLNWPWAAFLQFGSRWPESVEATEVEMETDDQMELLNFVSIFQRRFTLSIKVISVGNSVLYIEHN